MTFDDVYIAYLRERQLSKRDLSSHVNHLRAALDLFGKRKITDITTADLMIVKQYYLERKDFSPATVNTYLHSLRAVLNWAINNELRGPLKFPPIPAARYRVFVPPSAEELRRILEVAPEHIKRVIIVGYYLGARVGRSELFRLKWSDFDFHTWVVHMPNANKGALKPWRDVPITEGVRSMFMQWHQADVVHGMEYVINFKGKRVESIKHSWDTTLKKAGITRRIRPYDLRHAFATELVSSGVDVGTVAKLMGHSNPMMLLSHYAFVMDSQKKAAVDNLPDLIKMCQK